MNGKLVLQKAIDQQRFYDALNICKQFKINDSIVRSKIDDQIRLAEAAYENSDYEISINIFKTIIGVSEVSLVLSRFFRPHLQIYLIDYLTELHLQGFAAPSYTKLLFNLFIQCQAREKLNVFLEIISKAALKDTKTKKSRTAINTIKSKITGISSKLGNRDSSLDPLSNTDDDSNDSKKEDPKVKILKNFDINIAVEMLQKAGLIEEALKLSQAAGLLMTSLSSLIEDKKFNEAATQIFDHYDEPIGYSMLMKFGPILLKSDINAIKIVEQTATLIWKTHFDTPNQTEITDIDFIKLFWGHPQSCYNFLKSVIHEKPTELFADTLISLLIPKSKATPSSFFGNPSVSKSDEAINLIIDTRLPINCIHLLGVCSESGFLLGAALLLSRIGRPSDALSMLLQENAYLDLFKWIVISKPDFEQEDWFRLFNSFASSEIWSHIPISFTVGNMTTTKTQLMQIILSNIKDTVYASRIISFLLKNKDISVSVLKNGSANLFISIQEEYQKVNETNQSIVDHISKIDKKIDTIEHGVIEFNPNICDLCGEQINFPYICFFCGHHVHSKCLQVIDDQKRCPICHPCEESNNAIDVSRRPSVNFKLQ